MGCPHIDRRQACIKPHGGPPLQWLHWELPWRLAGAYVFEGKKWCQVGTNLQNQQFPITPDFLNLGIRWINKQLFVYTDSYRLYLVLPSNVGTNVTNFILKSFPFPTFQILHFTAKGKLLQNSSTPEKKYSQDLHFVRIPPQSHLEKQNFQKICLRHAILPQVLLALGVAKPNDFRFSANPLMVFGSIGSQIPGWMTTPETLPGPYDKCWIHMPSNGILSPQKLRKQHKEWRTGAPNMWHWATWMPNFISRWKQHF